MVYLAVAGEKARCLNTHAWRSKALLKLGDGEEGRVNLGWMLGCAHGIFSATGSVLDCSVAQFGPNRQVDLFRTSRKNGPTQGHQKV